MRQAVTLHNTRGRTFAGLFQRVAPSGGLRRFNSPGTVMWRLLLVLAALLVALVITRQWFTPGRLLAGGDNFPPYLIDPAKWIHHMRYAWDVTGSGAPSSLIEVLPQIVFDYLLRTVFSPAEAQHAFYVILYGAQFLSMTALVLTLLPGHRVAAITAALFYCFNPFAVLVPPGYLGLFLLVYLPYMAVLFIRIATRPLKLSSLAIFAVSASLSGILFVNPPLYMIFVWYAVFMVLYVIVQHWRSKVPMRIALLAALFIAANVYWIVQAYFVLFGTGHQQVIAAAAQDYSFVARRSSILNMFWLNPTWAWDFYFPYASVYKTPLLLATIFLPALLAFSSLLTRSIPRRVVLPATVGALVLLVVSTGLHGPDPFYYTFQFFLHHVPLFWLFREPDAKFPFLILVLYAPLIGCQVEWLSAQIARIFWQHWIGAAVSKACLVTLATLAFVVAAFPLVTGQVVGRDPSRGAAPGTAVPAYWFGLKDYLARQNPQEQGEVLVLPNDDFYQMHYSWGYYGADAIPGEFIPNRNITINASGGYVAATSKSVDLNGEILQAIRNNAQPTILPYLAAQGIEYIVQRNDIVSNEVGRHIISATQVRSYLDSQPYLQFIRSFGQLDLYKVKGRSYLPQVYALALPHTIAPRTKPVHVPNNYIMTSLGLPSGAHATHGNISRAAESSQVVRLPWMQVNPVRFIVRISPASGPLLLTLSTTYNPNWHACIVPDGTPIRPWTCWFHGFLPARDHVDPLGLFNGWLIAHPGHYIVVIDFGTQHIADTAALLSLLAVSGTILAALLIRCLRMVRALRGVQKLSHAAG